VVEKMDDNMITVWQSLLAQNYKGKEAEILAALAAILFAKGVLTREELDSLQEMLETKPKGNP